MGTLHRSASGQCSATMSWLNTNPPAVSTTPRRARTSVRRSVDRGLDAHDPVAVDHQPLGDGVGDDAGRCGPDRGEQPLHEEPAGAVGVAGVVATGDRRPGR